MNFNQSTDMFPKNPSGGGKKKNKKKKAGNKPAAKQVSVQSSQKPHFLPKIPSSIVTTHSGYFDVDRYSHHFVIKNISPIGQQLVNKFAMSFIQWETVGFGPYARKKPMRTFAARVRPLNQYRFHKGQWPEFVQFLSNNGVDINSIRTVVYGLHPPAPLNATLTTEKTPRDYQVPIIAYLVSPLPTKYKMLEVQAGKGKASSLYSHIKIPGGWSTMGEMKIGTEVITPKGIVTKVNGVFPQGNLDIYRITFSDGRQAECCLDHLWKVHLEKRQSKNYWEVFDLKTIMESSSFKTGRAYIPLIESEDCSDVDLPVHPWLLGVILGDGSISTKNVSITKQDLFIREKVQSLLEPGLRIGDVDNPITFSIIGDKNYGDGRNTLREKLTALELMGTHSHTKFIPKQYLHGSRQQRVDILSGLMDTDGFVDVNSVTNYTTTSFELAQGVQYLVRSLGGLANISMKRKYYTYLGEKKLGRVAYQVNIRHKTPSELFTLPRKKERTNDEHQYCKNLKLRIDKIELIGNMPAQCISVEDDEHMYVTNDFVATHNTYMASCAADALNFRIVMFLKLQFINKWEGDVDELLGVVSDDCIIIQGSNSLVKAIALIGSGQINPKVILVSNRTHQNWIKAYEELGDAVADSYGCTPNTFAEVMGAGTRIVDEVHMDFHLNVKIDLYTHIERSISLSATLISNDPFISRMHEMAYPTSERYNDLPFDKYVDAYAINYCFRHPGHLETSERGSDMYSHHAFERSVMANKSMFQAYLTFIEKLVNEYYTKYAVDGDKCLVYCTSIALCTALTEFLKVSFPKKDVRRYCELDPYENLLEPDIPVSTLQSAGTGHDLDNLICVVMTSGVNSKASNIQGFGRLRNLGKKKTRFAFTTCVDVPKLVKYRDEKLDLLSTRTTSLTTINYPSPIDDGIVILD